jgi:hypothetical protein
MVPGMTKPVIAAVKLLRSTVWRWAVAAVLWCPATWRWPARPPVSVIPN